MEVNLNVRLHVFIPEEQDTIKMRRRIPSDLVCGLTTVLERAIDDETLMNWLPSEIEIEMGRVGHDY